jgi:hypothetical protein
MSGDLMDRVFGDIKTKKEEVKGLSKEGLRNDTLGDNTLSDETLNLKVLDEVVETSATKRRMIGIWSPEIAAAMQYLKSTTPRFSISETAAKWITEGLERDHPNLISKVREEMKR